MLFLLLICVVGVTSRLTDGCAAPLTRPLSAQPACPYLKSALAKLTDPKNYLGLAGPMIDRVLALESGRAARS